MRVNGVPAVADEVKVLVASGSKLADHAIAKRILDLFRYNGLLPVSLRLKTTSLLVSRLAIHACAG